MKAKFTLLTALIAVFFTGFAQQVPNGSFENWVGTSPTLPVGWSTPESAESIPLNLFSFKDTTTFTQGHTSAEILADSTSLDPAAGVIPGFLSLGTSAIVGQQIQFIGVPFAFRPDTFFFDYKLASPNLDTALCQLEMTKDGDTLILGVEIPLTKVSTWTHVAIPLAQFYQFTSTPDTLLIQFFATNPQNIVNHDTLHVDAVGFGYINQPAPPITASIAAGGPTTFCNGDSVMLTANTGTNYTYQWNLGGTAISGATGSSYWAKAAGSYTVTIDSASSTATSSPIVVTDTTCHGVGINNVAATNLSVYPNPASSLLNINSNESLAGFTLQMYDVVGRLVISQVLEGNNNVINVAKLANGTYIYRVTDKENGVVAQSKFNVIK
jgi:type IX secretion system substrate protein